jgi:hypothetical protein
MQRATLRMTTIDKRLPRLAPDAWRRLMLSDIWQKTGSNELPLSHLRN